jgi:hypothetical protein
MIVRISTEGQYRMAERQLPRLQELDAEVVAAAESKDGRSSSGNSRSCWTSCAPARSSTTPTSAPRMRSCLRPTSRWRMPPVSSAPRA